MDDTTTKDLTDEDIRTVMREVPSPRPRRIDTMGGDGTDGDTTDQTDGDAGDQDGTDGKDADGTDSGDMDGTDSSS